MNPFAFQYGLKVVAGGSTAEQIANRLPSGSALFVTKNPLSDISRCVD